MLQCDQLLASRAKVLLRSGSCDSELICVASCELFFAILQDALGYKILARKKAPVDSLASCRASNSRRKKETSHRL